MQLIYHICTKSSWTDQQQESTYMHESINAEGFIHASDGHQVGGVLGRYFAGTDDLLLLVVDKDKVEPKLQYDEAPIGEQFPHIYGPLNKSAIIDTINLR